MTTVLMALATQLRHSLVPGIGAALASLMTW